MRRGLIFIAALVPLLLAPAVARAYPHWQFASGTTRCNQCHYAPGGGGLINEHGRDAAGEDLSTWPGDGGVLHGAAALPAFLKLGADARFALLSHDNGGPDAPKVAAFPMQADLHVRLAFGDFSFQGIGGVRGQVRRTDAPIPAGSFQPENESRLISREHWLGWQPASRGLYARAGRFFAPFGLRLAEHIVYVRRRAGFDNLQETYNLSAGYLENAWEGHVTLFGPDVLQNGNRERGVAAYGELRLLDEQAALAAQSRVALDDGIKRWTGGVIGKLFIARLQVLLMTEANYQRLMPDDTAGVGQFVGLLGASWLTPVRGTVVTAWAERLQGDVKTLDTAVGAVAGLVSWFPYPHFELQLVGRVQGADGGTTFKTLLAQFHYYL